MAHTVTISENAAKKISSLIAGEGNPALMFRVQVNGGGCSGFSYEFKLDAETTDEDVVFEQHGVKVVVDEPSLELMEGAVVDYKEDLIGSAFSISNPQATSTCGCGSSFSV